MVWIILPVALSLVSFFGTWTVYGIAVSNNHVCSLSDWTGENFCSENKTSNCCRAATISSSGIHAPENSLFSATINAASFLFLLFCIFHHAHVMERHSCQSMLSRFSLVFGVVAALGSFTAGNCNPGSLELIHYLSAGLSFLCICFYTLLLTMLTGKCNLTGHERILYPLRIGSTVIQAISTICYTVLFSQHTYPYIHLCALFEWTLSINLELFELSYAIEFYYFSSFMLSNLLSKREEEKPLMM